MGIEKEVKKIKRNRRIRNKKNWIEVIKYRNKMKN